jgi:hypothetical protein
MNGEVSEPSKSRFHATLKGGPNLRFSAPAMGFAMWVESCLGRARMRESRRHVYWRFARMKFQRIGTAS